MGVMMFVVDGGVVSVKFLFVMCVIVSLWL